jgi:hypothetical protein
MTIVLLFVGIQYFYMPKKTQLRMTKDKLAANYVRNERLRKLAENPQFFNDLMNKIDRHSKMIEQSLPREVKLSQILKELASLAAKNNINVLSIKPIEATSTTKTPDEKNQGDILESEMKDFAKSDIQIIFESDYSHLGTYVHELETCSLTVVIVKELTIAVDEVTRDSSKLKVLLSLTTFYKQAS